MADLGTLALNLEIRAAKFEQEMRRTNTHLAGLEKTASAARSAVMAMIPAVTVAGVTIFAKSVLDLEDAAAKSARALGYSVEELTALQYAFRLGGVQATEFEAAMRRLENTIASARAGEAAAKGLFKDLGLDPETLNSLSGVSRVAAVAEAFAGLADQSDRVRASMDLFGRSGAALLPVLQDGGEALRDMTRQADAFNAVISGDAARAAETFNDNLSRLNELGQAAGRHWVESLVPGANAMAEALIRLRITHAASAKALSMAELVDARDRLERVNKAFWDNSLGAQQMHDRLSAINDEIEMRSILNIADLEAATDRLRRKMENARIEPPPAAGPKLGTATDEDLRRAEELTRQMEWQEKYLANFDAEYARARAQTELFGSIASSAFADVATGAERADVAVQQMLRSLARATIQAAVFNSIVTGFGYTNPGGVVPAPVQNPGGNYYTPQGVMAVPAGGGGTALHVHINAGVSPGAVNQALAEVETRGRGNVVASLGMVADAKRRGLTR